MKRAAAPDVDAYIAAQPAPARAVLKKIRALIRKRAPGGEEGISYGIPTVRLQGRILAHFAGFKEHVGMFPPVRDSSLAKELKPYAGPKGNLKFPLDAPIPYALIEEVVSFHLQRVAGAVKSEAKTPKRKA